MKKGFTLIELLAVIVILSVILVIAVPQIMSTIKESKIESLNADSEIIAKYLEAERVNGIDVESYEISDLDNIGVDSTKYDSFGVSIVDDKIVVSIEQDGYITENKLDSKVYGVTFPNTTVGTRTDDAVGLTYTVNASTITSSFDTADIYKDIVDYTDTYGNVFVKIPKFWIKKTKSAGNVWTYQISKTKQDNDYYLPYCFNQQGKILPYVLIGKYNGSLNGTKLESKSGVIPLVSASMSTFRTYAKNNNVGGGVQGYQLIDIHAIDVIQTLFLVEFATLNSQTIIQGYTNGLYSVGHTIASVSGSDITLTSPFGTGYRIGQMFDVGTSQGGRQIRTNLRITNINGNILTYEILSGISGGTGTIAAGQLVYNIPNINGNTNSVSTQSGSPTSNTDGKYSMKYRLIENIYGNMWQFIDGINIKNNVAYVSKNASNYNSDVFTGDYNAIGYTNANSSNYVLELGYDTNNPYINFPISTTGSGIYQDYYYQGAGNRSAFLGGSWYSGSLPGLFCWDLIDVHTIINISVGSRLMKTAL